MANARQQYWADWSYVDKQNKEFTLTQEIIEKLDSIEPGAERNFIQWIKRNWVLQEPDQYRIVNLTIPDVVDDLNSTDRTNALSARQGRILYNYIQNLQSLGKFLSNWNSATWLPTTNPSALPYDYHSGDYFIVSSVSTSTNYKPTWSQYEWVASTTVETEEVKVWDFYMYDWTEWLLLVNTEREIPIDTSLSPTSTNPVENRVVTNAINSKQDILIPWTNVQIAQDGKTISATDTTYSAWTNISIDANNEISAVDTTYTAWANVQISNNNVISATDTVYWAWDNIQISANNIISATDTTYTDSDFDISLLSDSQGKRAEWNAKQDKLTAWSNIQIAQDGTISATDTTYQASDFDISDLADANWKRTTWDAKQNALTAWSNIQISWNTISATDTKYTAGSNVQISNSNVISATDTTYDATDFDIKDLADSTNLRTKWTWKQDKLQAGSNIEISSDWKTISAIDTKYTAWTWIDITNWVISNTQTSAEWWNIQWDITDQTDLQTALNWKQNTISDLATIRSGAALWATSVQPNDNVSDLVNDAGYITLAEIPTIGNATLTLKKNGTTIDTFTANATVNKSIDITVPTKTSDITNDSGYITSSYHDSTKQDKLIAWSNIQIANDWKTISATDTTYTASDFDIKNLADSTSLRTTWSGKQDKLVAGTNIQIASDGKTISATDTITEVDDSLSSTSTTHALSAAQGKVLNDKISDLQAMGKFLSTWDASTWQPTTFPYSTPYTYHTWDYYLVSTVGTWTKYKPNWASYTWSASTTVESWDVAVWDMYIYDGSTWILQMNHWKEISFANITWQPSDNTALATALGGKQATLVSWTNIKTINNTSLLWSWNISVQSVISDLATIRSWASAWATAIQPNDNISELSNDAWYITSSSIPTVGNATITIQKNWSNVNSFTTNATSNKTINITMAKGDVGLWNVDNTSDVNKPVSTATQTALDWKINTPIEVTVATAYNTAAKVGTTSWWSYSPTEGDFLMVNFVNGSSVASPTLNIDWSWAKNIRTGNADATTATMALWSTADSNVKILMYYDGTYYRTWSTTNNTYSAMTQAQAGAGTATAARTISAAVLKAWVQAHAPVQSVNWQTWAVTISLPTVNNSTITYTQAWDTIGSSTTNQSSASTITIRWDVYCTQAQYNALPSTKLTDGNTYIIYE